MAFSETQIMLILYSVSNALTLAHMGNIFHCNMKPSSIFINKEGKVKLGGDFGVSADDEFWDFGEIAPAFYASPEMMYRQKINGKTDIWSLGIILYELCTL